MRELTLLPAPDENPIKEVLATVLKTKSTSASRRGWIALATVVGLAAAPREAHAYLDPGSGSYLLQILLGGALAAAYAVRLYWAKIRATVFHRTAREEPQDRDGRSS